MKFLLPFLLLFIAKPSSAEINFVRVLFFGDASTSATIAWNQVSGNAMALCLDSMIHDDDNNIPTYEIDRIKSAKNMNNHFARLSGLRPGTRYYFKIEDDQGFSKQFYFTTIEANPDRISLVAGGDSRDKRETRKKGNLMLAKLKAHAVLFNGDFTGLDTPKQWVEWFEDWEASVATDGRVTPMVVTRGNHELTNKSLINLFDVPNKSIYYDTQFGDSLLNVISLNSEIWKFGRQRLFLRHSLKTHNNYTWQIPQYHRPIRAHVAHKKEMQTQYRNFLPLFEKHKNVRLCLENDSHTCKITWPIVSSEAEGSEEGFIRNDSIGIVYAGEGCWGAPLREANDSKCWTRDAEAVNQINWIFVDAEKIELRTIIYENSSEVEELEESTRFQMPKNLNLWTPKNGELVVIYPRKD